MSQQKFKMTIIIPTEIVGCVLEVLKDCGTMVSLIPAEEESPPAPAWLPFPPLPPLLRKPRYVNGMRNKGIPAEDLVLEILSNGTVHSTQSISKLFVARGFASSSATATLSKLNRMGKISRTSDGNWFRVRRATEGSSPA